MNLTYNNKAQTKALLTKEIDKYFKIQFDFRIEDDYKLSTIDTVNFPNTERLFYEGEKNNLRKALLNFIEDATSKTYTDVENKYGRKRDKNDKAIDTEFDSEEFPIIHYSIAEKGICSLARIHGYIREGVFIVRRIDWGHNYHPKKKKSSPISK